MKEATSIANGRFRTMASSVREEVKSLRTAPPQPLSPEGRGELIQSRHLHLAADDGGHCTTGDLPAIERRVPALRPELFRVNCPGRLRVEDGHVGGATGGEGAAVHA